MFDGESKAQGSYILESMGYLRLSMRARETIISDEGRPLSSFSAEPVRKLSQDSILKNMENMAEQRDEEILQSGFSRTRSR